MASLSSPSLRLDPTPTWEEEWRDFLSEDRFRGVVPFDKESAKRRVDKIARRLAICWSAFLIYIILAQAFGHGLQIIMQWDWPPAKFSVQAFNLKSTEFIAVVTTTTASVFGFLVIIATNLFKSD